MIQLITPEKFRGRMMGVFQLSNRGLHPLGQLETGLAVPLLGAREATIAGGIVVLVTTLVTAWRIPAIGSFRWDQRKSVAEDDNSLVEPSVRAVR
jgi:MFS-type transporter involved in bile tolerance (Atg22 family)